MNRLETLRRSGERDLDKAFGEVLRPWVRGCEEIFRFREADPYYNFAVYLLNEESKLLECAYRTHGSKIAPQNRKWRSGDGHVGFCYSQQETIFSLYHVGPSGEPEIVDISQPRPEDKRYYNSFAATPLMVGEEPKGVFIVTSSKRDQLVKELHEPVMDIAGWLLARTWEFCGEEG